ncbi:MAG: hypothetical protein MI725_12315 [Pirellulales bacterium]|nr:hypothetical protein [Pirellulales bacterium]
MRYCIQFIAALVVFAPGFAWGAPVAIPGLFTTGVNNSGANLPFGTADPHWILSGPLSGPNAFVQSPRPTSWIANTTQSQWIGPNANGMSTHFSGTYVYRLFFDLTGFDETTAVIQGSWASDNGSQIVLNGVSTGNNHSGGSGAFSAFDTFTISSGFVPGLNNISIHVTNLDSGGFPITMRTQTGLQVAQLSGLAERVIPEPASCILFIGSGIGLLAMRRHKFL